MLDKIKAPFFVRLIFSLIEERTKLLIMKKNKKMLNLLRVNEMNYKRLSGKYKVYQENGKGMEYDSYNDVTLFEGEYLDRERSGIGREYDYSKNIIFEGEYSKGKRNGKGKEYYPFDKIKFEGEFLKGKKWNGKGYDLQNNIIYELNGGNGYIKEYNEDGYLNFEGEYLNGELNGAGK